MTNSLRVPQEVFRNTLAGASPSSEELTAPGQLSGLVEDNGQPISADRLLGGHDEAAPMAQLIESQGVTCVQQDLLVVAEPVMVESFPISVFQKQE